MNQTSLANRVSSTAPFPHFTAQSVLDEQDSELVLRWLESDAPWRLKIAEFYEQYEFSVSHVSLPIEVQSIFSSNQIDMLKMCLEQSFAVRLSDRHNITAHKLVPGQRIRIHNDYIPDQETHRVLVQLNRGWHDDFGGTLLFFNSSDSRDISRAFRPLHNTCVSFEISSESHHAVTPIHAGERFTLVVSFYREKP